ncbi:MAG: glycosyltransferase [Syntrophaceae bacterium]
MVDRLRVMHVLESLEIGGLENGVVNIANNIDAGRFETVICCIRREGPLKMCLKPQVKVICLNKKPGFDPMTALTVARLCRQEKISVMHTHGWAAGLYCGVIGARMAGVPAILNGEHGVFYLDKKRRLIAQKLLFSLTHTIVPVSLDLKKDIIRHLGTDPAKIVPIMNGVDTDQYKPDDAARRMWRKHFAFSDSDVVIGTVGRLVPIKDYATLLHAGARIIQKQPATKLVFIGDGQQRDELVQLAASLGITVNVRFMGARNNVSELLNMLDVFALTSIDEGLSNSILEAMSTGKPVVATSVGDNSEIVIEGKTGFLVPVGCVEALTEALLKCTDISTAKHMGAAARQYIEDNFSLQRMIRNYENLYTACVERRRYR